MYAITHKLYVNYYYYTYTMKFIMTLPYVLNISLLICFHN